MPEHSSEPWSAADNNSVVFDAKGKVIIEGMGYDDWFKALAVSDEDMRRLLACVNACAGIPTEDLEQQVHGLTAAVVAYRERLAEAERLLRWSNAYVDYCESSLTAEPGQAADEFMQGQSELRAFLGQP